MNMIYSKSRTSWRWRPRAFALVQNSYAKIIIASNLFQNTLTSIAFPVCPTHRTEYEWTYFRAGGTCRKLQWKLVNNKKIDRTHMKLKNVSRLQWNTKVINNQTSMQVNVITNHATKPNYWLSSTNACC